MKGRLIVFEGADGSGKATQAALLKEALTARGEQVKSVTFPNYESPAAGPVRMYLAGEFGAHPDDVSPYAASTLYAVDRYASYKSDWGAFYEAGGTVVADRYVTSNMVHQMTKLRSAKEKREFLQWLDAFEYGTLELPRPDLVILLDIPRDVPKNCWRRARKIKIRPRKRPISMKQIVNIWHVAMPPTIFWRRITAGSGSAARTVIVC